jgi:uncharacterized membrane protein
VYLAWDGGNVIQRVMQQQNLQAYSAEVYRAVYEHYFSNVSEQGWSGLSIFISVSNVMNLYVWAPLTMMLAAVLLSNEPYQRWKWLIIGASLTVIGLLLWLMPRLMELVVILD